MNNMQKTMKRLSDSKVVIDNIVYESNVTKKINISNPDTGNRINCITIGETTYYPVAITKEKKVKEVKEKMATIS
jgi:hypothetical protein